ncbi:hypothetical protein SLEP1_g59628, partial [Rubroshorea leprosula]
GTEWRWSCFRVRTTLSRLYLDPHQISMGDLSIEHVHRSEEAPCACYLDGQTGFLDCQSAPVAY